MLKRTMIVLMLASALAACNSTSKNGQAAQPDTTEEKAQGGKTFGASFAPEGAVAFAELPAKLEGKDSLALKVTGTVQEVCQVKGCWMVVASGESEESSVMVRFKDYGFFVPKDIAGQKVIMDGYAFREVTPVDELRHYAEDAGKSQEEIEAITEPKEELKFLASGVILLDEK